jgi:hypothetical protein
MCDVAHPEFDITRAEISLDARLSVRVDELVRQKYSQEAYNHKR